MGWFQQLSQGLTKTRKNVQDSLRRLVSDGPNPVVLEEVEAALLGADVGVRAVERLIDRLRDQMGGADHSTSIHLLKDALCEILQPAESDPIEDLIRKGPRPFVILAVGVNGVGKTTSLGKLGSRLRQAGMKPLFVAADTFRAAAIEQLGIWGERIEADVIKHQHGADPAAVVFDGIAAAKARGVDECLCSKVLKILVSFTHPNEPDGDL